MLSGRELLYMSCTGSSRRPKSTIRFGTWTLYRFVLSSLGNYSSFHRIKKYFLNLCTVQCEVDFRALKKVVFIDGRSALMLWVLVEPSIKTRLKSFPTCKFWTRRVPISMGMDGERAIVVASRVFELCWIMICHAIDPCRHISAHVLLVTQLCCQLWKQIDFDLKLSSFFFSSHYKDCRSTTLCERIVLRLPVGFWSLFPPEGWNTSGVAMLETQFGKQQTNILVIFFRQTWKPKSWDKRPSL